jgi:hypothetical protein
VAQHHQDRPWFWLSGEDGVSRALVGVRHAAGLTQAQAAARLRMDRTTLLNMEAGRNLAVSRFISLFSRMGYDLIAVPHGARVSVAMPPDESARS